MANTISGDYTMTVQKSYEKVAENKSQLDQDDFYSLLVAQLSNQDIMNPTGDLDFIAQMAQFSTLQSMKTLTEYTESAYAVSYVGKYAVSSSLDEKTGDLKNVEGIIEKVIFYDGAPQVVIDGSSYPLYTIMEIKTPPAEANTETADESENEETEQVENIEGGQEA